MDDKQIEMCSGEMRTRSLYNSYYDRKGPNIGKIEKYQSFLQSLKEFILGSFLYLAHSPTPIC